MSQCTICTDDTCCICQSLNDACPDQPTHPQLPPDPKRIEKLEAALAEMKQDRDKLGDELAKATDELERARPVLDAARALRETKRKENPYDINEAVLDLCDEVDEWPAAETFR